MVVSVYVREGMGYGMKITCGVAPWIEAGRISWIVASPPERKRGRRRGAVAVAMAVQERGRSGVSRWCAQVR